MHFSSQFQDLWPPFQMLGKGIGLKKIEINFKGQRKPTKQTCKASNSSLLLRSILCYLSHKPHEILRWFHDLHFFLFCGPWTTCATVEKNDNWEKLTASIICQIPTKKQNMSSSKQSKSIKWT